MSPATVSRIINRTARVSPDIEKRVPAAAEQLGYDLSRKSGTKLMVGGKPLWNFSEIFQGGLLFCYHLEGSNAPQEDYSDLLLLPLRYAGSQEWRKLNLPAILSRGDVVDGYIVAGVNYQNLLDFLTDTRLPFSILGDTVQGEWKSSEYDVICVDNHGGAYDLTRYLQSLGRTRLAFVANTRLAWFQRRWRGYCRAMEEAGLEPIVGSIDSDDEKEAGFLATKQLLARPNLAVEAIFGGSDAVCHGIYAALREARLRVPEDVSVAGFNDTPEAVAVYPPLTSVRVFPELLGKQLGEMVLSRIANAAHPPRKLVIPTQLVKRESCLPLIRPVEVGIQV